MGEQRLNLWMPLLWGAVTALVLRVVPPCCCCGCLNALIAGAVAGGVLAWSAKRLGLFPDISQGLLVGIGSGLVCGAFGAVAGLASAPFYSSGSMDQLFNSLPGDDSFRDLLRQAMEQELNQPLWRRLLTTASVEFGGGAVLGALGGVVTTIIMRQPPTTSVPPSGTWTPPPIPPDPGAGPWTPPSAPPSGPLTPPPPPSESAGMNEPPAPPSRDGDQYKA